MALCEPPVGARAQRGEGCGAPSSQGAAEGGAPQQRAGSLREGGGGKGMEEGEAESIPGGAELVEAGLMEQGGEGRGSGSGNRRCAGMSLEDAKGTKGARAKKMTVCFHAKGPLICIVAVAHVELAENGESEG